MLKDVDITKFLKIKGMAAELLQRHTTRCRTGLVLLSHFIDTLFCGLSEIFLHNTYNHMYQEKHVDEASHNNTTVSSIHRK
jgi:hypothetical protein